jgi:ComF family protein
MEWRLSDLWDVLYPPSCIACQRLLIPGAAFFCAECVADIDPLPAETCRRCGEPGGLPACPRCRQSPPPFERAVAPFAHSGAVARAIHQLKYEDHPELAPRLASLLVQALPDFFKAAPTALCPIPLHPSRFRARRYDQAELITHALAKRTSRRVLRSLKRVLPTRRQVGLTEAEREANVAGAFVASSEVKGQDVLLVDDVFTTGATARAASRALLEAGARSVQVTTVARAYNPG